MDTNEAYHDRNRWLPVTLEEMDKRGWEQADVILITGDAYVDHPSFGIAVIARVLESRGFKVAVIPQPNWRDDLRDFKKLGRPRLFFGVSAGNMDSMVNHYTARKRKRSDDAFSPGNKANFRPDYAATVYSKILKELFPDVPVVLGGVEASLRRLTHFDYWSEGLKPSILVESKADLLVYGMGESAISLIALQLDEGKPISSLTDIPQIAYISNHKPNGKFILLPAHEECLKNPHAFAQHFVAIEQASNAAHGEMLVEPNADEFVIINPPANRLSEAEMDKIYLLPFTRLPHPKYLGKPAIPAYEMIRHSVTIHRGCFGGCAFCTISMHQGRFIQSRTEESILYELEQVSKMHDFKGMISDLGGPSANMYGMHPKDSSKCANCKRQSCIYPKLCPNINASHARITKLYQQAAKIIGIKKVVIGSGIRYDLFMNENGFLPDGKDYMRQLVQHHISGRLKVAPEHSAEDVLKSMRKPPFAMYVKFKREFTLMNQDLGMNQQLIPYLIASHPACDNEHMAELAIDLAKTGYRPEQVQDFTPTPMTLSSAMYYLGFDPYTLNKVVVTRKIDEKNLQNQFLLWHVPQNKATLIKAIARFKNKALAVAFRQLLSK